MLVLTRKLNERLTITTPDGTRIVVMICKVKGDNVRLGIAAPKNYSILREDALIHGRTLGAGGGTDTAATEGTPAPTVPHG